jgi:hypothetical protein
MGLGMPSAWHKRQAMLLAAQLPENSADARMILQAMQELIDNFLDDDAETLATLRRKPNVLPFPMG